MPSNKWKKKTTIVVDKKPEKRFYEYLWILSPHLAVEEVQVFIDKILSILAEYGCIVLNKIFWGKKELAVPIDKYNTAIYYLLYFTTYNGAKVLDRIFQEIRYDETVLRRMVKKIQEETVQTSEELSFVPLKNLKGEHSGTGGKKT